MQTIDLSFQAGDFSIEFGFAQMLEPLRNKINRSAKLTQSFTVTVKQAYRQRADLRRKLVLQHAQGRRFLRSNQHPPSRRKIVADDIGNRVGFPCSRGTLNNNTIAHRQALSDLDLLCVERLREKQLFAASVGGRSAGNAVDAAKSRKIFVLQIERRIGEQRRNGGRDSNVVFAVFAVFEQIAKCQQVSH